MSTITYDEPRVRFPSVSAWPKQFYSHNINYIRQKKKKNVNISNVYINSLKSAPRKG